MGPLTKEQALAAPAEKNTNALIMSSGTMPLFFNTKKRLTGTDTQETTVTPNVA
jgi:hypothetical protein